MIPNAAAVGEVIGDAMLRRRRGRRLEVRSSWKRLDWKKDSGSDGSSLSVSDSPEPSLLEKEPGRCVRRGASEWKRTLGFGSTDRPLLPLGSLEIALRLMMGSTDGALRETGSIDGARRLIGSIEGALRCSGSIEGARRRVGSIDGALCRRGCMLRTPPPIIDITSAEAGSGKRSMGSTDAARLATGSTDGARLLIGSTDGALRVSGSTDGALGPRESARGPRDDALI